MFHLPLNCKPILGGLALTSLLLLAACDSRPAPPATPTPPAPTVAAPPTAPASPAPTAPAQGVVPTGTAQPDYTPVIVGGGLPYVPPEPWLAAPTLVPGQPTPTPYGGIAPGNTGRGGKTNQPTPTAAPPP